MELAEKVALVTGGSRGIGRAISIRLAALGARVAVNYFANEALAKEVVAEIERSGGEAIALRGDVGVASDVERAISAVQERWGKVDILVNNAGITRDSLLMRMSEDDWDQVMATNLRGVFLCTRACLRQMVRQRWGRVINISSVAGVVGNAGQANYSATKAALMGFTKSVAKEVALRNITVNAVAPGFIETDMVAQLSQTFREQALAAIPAGRMGTPEDVAEVVAFLAGEGAGYITGQVVQVDGGLAM